MRNQFFRLAPVLAVIAAGCNEPYTKAENEDAAPVVVATYIVDNIGHDELATNEAAVFETFDYRPGGLLLGSSRPWFRFNKLLNGETIEIVEKDEATGRDLAKCKAVDGAFEVTVGGTPVTPLRACYDPSVYLITLSEAAVDPETGAYSTGHQFFPYDTEMVWATGAITDKQGRPVERTEVRGRTAAFQVLTVTDGAGEATIYSSPAFTAALGKDPVTPTVAGSAGTAGLLRIVFSGPVHVYTEDDPATADVDETGEDPTNFAGIELQHADGTEVAVMGPSGPVSAHVGFFDLVDDPRILYVVSPEAQLAPKSAPAGLTPGDYRLFIPATTTDSGEVTGTPVPLGADIIIPFTVAPEAAR